MSELPGFEPAIYIESYKFDASMSESWRAKRSLVWDKTEKRERESGLDDCTGL